MARCNCNPMCERCCNGPCDCTCEPEAAPIDDRLAGGGDFDVIAFLDRELAATGAQSYDTTAEGLMRTKGYIAALRQRLQECARIATEMREAVDAIQAPYEWIAPSTVYAWADEIHAAIAHDAQEKK